MSSSRKNFNWSTWLDRKRLADDESMLCERRRMALQRAKFAGEALAHGELEIAATEMRLAEYFLQQALDAAVAPYVRERARRRSGQRRNPGGRPSEASRDDEWLRNYEARQTAWRQTLTSAEIYADIASDAGKPVSTVRTAISKARARRKQKKQR